MKLKKSSPSLPDSLHEGRHRNAVVIAGASILSVLTAVASIYLFMVAGRSQLPEPLASDFLAPSPVSAIAAPLQILTPPPVLAGETETEAIPVTFVADSPLVTQASSLVPAVITAPAAPIAEAEEGSSDERTGGGTGGGAPVFQTGGQSEDEPGDDDQTYYNDDDDDDSNDNHWKADHREFERRKDEPRQRDRSDGHSSRRHR